MHSGKMRVETRIDPEMLEYEMLNLLLQPLVENAVVHGLDHKTEAGEKILRVQGELREGELIFTVEAVSYTHLFGMRCRELWRRWLPTAP